MKSEDIFKQIILKKSFLSVGLDSDYHRIPEIIKKEPNPQFSFNKEVIEATADKAISFKINTAFYEARGFQGFKELQLTAEYIKDNHPDIFLIADAKRGDIGNTSEKYAEAFFKTMPFDAITLSPYMGTEVYSPFIKMKDKWVIVLAITSNKGSQDFQFLGNENKKLFQDVIAKSVEKIDSDRLMFVAGATNTNQLKEIRKQAPNYFLLVPGVGHQGGNLREVCHHGMNNSVGLIVNSSRSVIFPESNLKFPNNVSHSAFEIQTSMSEILKEKDFI